VTAEEEQSFWTLQAFATVAGRSWYALQRQSDAGIERQYTGYAPELQALAARLGIQPEELGAATEEEFFRRYDELMPEGP
jgi:hypothetical protein